MRQGRQRASGFRDQTKVMAGQERCEQRRGWLLRVCSLSSEISICWMGFAQESCLSASRLGVFGDEVVKALCDAAHLAGEDVVQRASPSGTGSGTRHLSWRGLGWRSGRLLDDIDAGASEHFAECDQRQPDEGVRIVALHAGKGDAEAFRFGAAGFGYGVAPYAGNVRSRRRSSLGS